MKLKAEHETEAFINDNGYYAIKQITSLGEDDVIELTPSQMRLLIRHMRHFLKTKEEWFLGVEVE